MTGTGLSAAYVDGSGWLLMTSHFWANSLKFSEWTPSFPGSGLYYPWDLPATWPPSLRALHQSGPGKCRLEFAQKAS